MNSRLEPTLFHQLNFFECFNYNLSFCIFELNWIELNFYLEFGCAAGRPDVGFQFSSPSHDVIVTVGSSSDSRPSQNTPPSDVVATLVNIVLVLIVSIAMGFVLWLVPWKLPRSCVHFSRCIVSCCYSSCCRVMSIFNGVDGVGKWQV